MRLTAASTLSGPSVVRLGDRKGNRPPFAAEGGLRTVTRDELASRFLDAYCRKYGGERLATHGMRVNVMANLLCDYASTLCDTLCILGERRTKGICREIRAACSEFDRHMTSPGYLDSNQLKATKAVAAQFDSRNDECLGRFHRSMLKKLGILKSSPEASGLIADPDVVVTAQAALAVWAGVEDYCRVVDSELDNAGLPHPPLAVLPKSIMAIHAALRKLLPLLVTSLGDGHVGIWKTLANTMRRKMFALGVYRDPRTGGWHMFQCADKREYGPGRTPPARPGSWVLVCWRSPLASKYVPGQTMRVRSCSRVKDGSLLLRTDVGMMSSRSYEWEVLPENI